MAAAHLLQTTAETLILAAEDCAPEVTELAAKLADANEQLEAARVRLKIPKGMKIVPNLRHRR